MAYVDQLERDSGLERSFANDLARALRRAGSRLEDGRSDAELAARLTELGAGIELTADDSRTRGRVAALTAALTEIAAELR
jgi:hypothetical protein